MHKRLLGEHGGEDENRIAAMLSAGVREVDGGHWHYRDLQDAGKDTDLSPGFR